MRALIVFFVAGLFAFALAACSPDEPRLDLKGTDITGAGFGGDFTLTDQHGKQRSLSEFKGKAVALFFGYTHCPDVCPTTMAEFAAARQSMGEAAKSVRVLFVTVDPERDTVKVLADYVPHFDPSFLGLTGTPAEVKTVTERFKVVAQKQGAGADYTVDHSAGSYLFGKDGRLRVYEPYGTPSAALAHDLQQLLR
ncbi:SCO family protein [Crenobacter cavernae]|uniref:SCO family protein n=1 Tax=Crenobacter cavernae TaxID=2290923 RepID=A0A345Y5F3_9NEIS|nr:SCO family protein [Crenobacter cavernae]AXK39155.1 SCO family protein [Crenobacter cavernae]